MICPKCNKDNSENAKFCSGCGTRLEPVQMRPVQENPAFCSNCGKPLRMGAKFCGFCGATAGQGEKKAEPAGGPTPGQRQEAFGGDGKNTADAETVLLSGGPERQESNATVLMGENNAAPLHSGPSSDPSVIPSPPDQAPSAPGPQDKKGNKAAVILIAAAVCLFAAAAVIAIFYLVPRIGSKTAQVSVAEDVSSEEDRDDAENEETEEDTVAEEIPEEDLADLEDTIAQGEEELEAEHYGDEDGCLALLEGAMAKCVELNAVYARSEELEKLAQLAFYDYAVAILEEVELLFEQDIRPELYEQMESDINASLEQAEKLKNAGFEIDTDMLDDMMKELTASYMDRYIERFNKFTEGETWSRTESWDLMKDADEIGLVDYGDMDDPMTQRYAYALARATLKETENGMKDGSMDPAGAADKLEEVLKDSDYNLYLMSQLVEYLSDAGDIEKAGEVERCLNDITDHIAETQGIYVGPYGYCDFAYDWFWNFNEFESAYSVSSENGLTKENHEWIRNYMDGRL